MTDNKIVGLRGALPPLTTLPPNEALIASLERLLERARAGQAQGILGVVTDADYSTECICAGALTYSSLGRAYCVLNRFAADLENDL